jgi:hypothetical protein
MAPGIDEASGGDGFDPKLVGRLLEDRIAAMKRLVLIMGPGSNAEALRALRDAFPDAPLSERVAALQRGEAGTMPFP